MKKRTSSFITAIAVMMGMMLAAPAASATETTTQPPPSCKVVNETNSDNGTCADITREAAANSSTTDKSVAAVGTNGKLLTRYRVAAGVKLKASEKGTTGCKLVTKFSQVSRGATCFRGARGYHFTNSGYDASGNYHEWADYVGSPGSSTPDAKWMKFVKRDGKWLKAGDQVGKGNCANITKHGARPKPKLNWKQVINIRSFANWEFEGKVAVQASSSAAAFSKSWCAVDGNMAVAQAESEGSSNASASASYKLKGLTKIRQWTNAKEAELNQSLKLQVNAEATAHAKTKASAEASTKVKCSSTQPQPPQPEVTPPTFMQFRQINDVYVNATTDHCVTVDFPEGHSGEVFWTATYGSFATVKKSAQDTVQVCSTYKAPSEVPSGGKDTITVTATDSVTGKSVTQTSDPFTIKAMPVTP